MTALSSTIKAAFAGYLSGTESLEALSSRLIAGTWDLGPDEDPEAYKLVGQFLLAWSEYTGDTLDEAGVRRRIVAALSTTSLAAGQFERFRMVTGSGRITRNDDRRLPQQGRRAGELGPRHLIPRSPARVAL